MFSKIPPFLKKILNNATMGTIATISDQDLPVADFIHFSPHTDSTLLFVINKTSKLITNLSNNPYFSFTIDEIHLEDPTKNSGLMFEGKLTPLLYDEKLKIKFNYEEDLLKTSHLYLGSVSKIIMWRGPYFKTLKK